MPKTVLLRSLVLLNSPDLLPITLIELSLEGSCTLYNIEKTNYGFRITASGDMDISEAEQLTSELFNTLTSQKKQFSLIIDLRELIPFTPGVLEQIVKMQVLCKHMSLQRAAIILDSPMLRAQGKRISCAADTNDGDRYINASKVEDWEEQALAWAADAVEPTMISAR